MFLNFVLYVFENCHLSNISGCEIFMFDQTKHVVFLSVKSYTCKMTKHVYHENHEEPFTFHFKGLQIYDCQARLS